MQILYYGEPPLLTQDFVFGLSIILRGTINDRLNWAFNLYDLNKDGCITKEVMHRGHTDTDSLYTHNHTHTQKCHN